MKRYTPKGMGTYSLKRAILPDMEEANTMAQDNGKTVALTTRQSTGLNFKKPIDVSLIPLPEAVASLLEEGFAVQRHLRLEEGDCVRGTYQGMEDGELSSAQINQVTGEVTNPKVKWVYLEASGIRVRLLGGVNMVSALSRVREGSEVFIGRGADFKLPNNMQCTDYWVMAKEYKPSEPKVVQGERVA